MLTEPEINKYIKEAVQSSHPIKEVTTVIAIIKENESKRMVEEIFKEKFISYLMGRSKCDREYALMEYKGVSGNVDFKSDDPHFVVDECMSCWTE